MREGRKVSTDKSFNAYCGKENKEMGQVTRRGCGSRDGLFFFFLFQVRTIIMYLYADRNNSREGNMVGAGVVSWEKESCWQIEA